VSICVNLITSGFYTRELAACICYVCLGICLTSPGTNPSTGKIQTSGIHHMIA